MSRQPNETFCAGIANWGLHFIWDAILYVHHTTGDFTTGVMAVVIGKWVASAARLCRATQAVSKSAHALLNTVCILCVSFTRSVMEVVFDAENQWRVLLFVRVSAMVAAAWLLLRLLTPGDNEAHQPANCPRNGKAGVPQHQGGRGVPRDGVGSAVVVSAAGCGWAGERVLARGRGSNTHTCAQLLPTAAQHARASCVWATHLLWVGNVRVLSM
jgi:hypothetical protein